MEYVRLGDYVNIKTGKLDANAATSDGLYPFFTCSKEISRIDKYSYDTECVLVAGNGDLNVKYYNGKFDAYQRTYIIENNQDSLFYVKYIFYFMCRYIYELKKQTVGGIIKFIKLGNLTEARIPLLSKKEQLNVISLFEKINCILESKTRELTDLDTLIKSQFIEMFGNPITNEKKYSVLKLKNISEKITNGNTPHGGDKNYVEKGIIFIRSQNVLRNKIDLSDVVYIDESTNNSIKDSMLKSGDILITKTGRINTENSSLGRPAIFEGEDYSANLNGHVYLIRLNDRFNKKFVLYTLLQDEYREYIRSVCVGGIDKRQINKNHVEDFPILVAPRPLQDQFAAIVEQIDKSKSILQKQIDFLQELLDSKMQEYFG